MISDQGSNAIIYTTYSLFLVFGIFVGIKYGRGKSNFIYEIASVGAAPLTFNFIASGNTVYVGKAGAYATSTESCALLCLLRRTAEADQDNACVAICLWSTISVPSTNTYLAMGSSILFSYPELGTIAGVLGVTVYAIASSLPILTFAIFGPIIRKKVPKGFLLTEFIMVRFGRMAGLFYSICCLVTMFIYLVAELTAIKQVIETLTTVNGLPVMIVECVITTIYTSIGGFKTSLITDNVQGSMIILLIVICAIAVGTQVDVQPDLIHGSGLLAPTKLGWQLLYILPVAIVFNDYFLAGFWQRTFASKNDRSLWIACISAATVIFVIVFLVGFTGVIAAWTGVWPGTPAQPGSTAFFLILGQLPNWVVGFVIVFAVCMSTAAYDSLQSAIVSTVSNDIFRNKVGIWYCRLGVLLLNGPAIALAIRNANVLILYLVSDLLSACVMPAILLGLWDKLHFLNGFDIIVSGLGGILSVWVFGTLYYGSPAAGGNMLINLNLYGEDWGAFGAFMVAPGFGIVFLLLAFVCRYLFAIVRSKVTGAQYNVFENRQNKIGEARDQVEMDSSSSHTPESDDRMASEQSTPSKEPGKAIVQTNSAPL